jgi:hypothetical protein
MNMVCCFVKQLPWNGKNSMRAFTGSNVDEEWLGQEFGMEVGIGKGGSSGRGLHFSRQKSVDSSHFTTVLFSNSLWNNSL